MNASEKPLALGEFIPLVALMVSIAAMATDVMLPALQTIGADLGVTHPNEAQLVVSTLFAGFGVGQLLAGPLADSFGRKRTIYAGYAVFILGCLLSIFAPSLEVMLAGRVLQGLGAAAPRIVAVAIVRDSYEGRAMARVMSIVLAVFILVPAVAPAIGQGIIFAGGWHATFVFLIAQAAVTALWLGTRQPETLKPEDKRPFSPAAVWAGVKTALGHRTVVGYTLAAGCIFGSLIAYLSSAQQVFQSAYGVGDLFALYFAIAALGIGAGSVISSRLVMRLGMRYLVIRAVSAKTLLAFAFLAPVMLWEGLPPFWLFMGWLTATFFCFGFVFGNLNALAMEPLGHMAGLGAALVGAGSTFVSLPIGGTIGQFFDGGVTPMVLGYALLGCGALAALVWTERSRPDPAI